MLRRFLNRLPLLGLLCWPLLSQKPDGAEFFESKIRPVLTSKCYACHSATAAKPMGGLLLDTREGIRRGGASGMPAIVPNYPEKSLLLTAIRQTGTLKMPLGGVLSADVIADFETWIRMGAPDPREGKATAVPPPYDFAKARQHWSYRPVQDPAPPEIRDPLWNKTPIDRFIRAKLDKEGLIPVRLATRQALIRRATFDLIGLPPTPEEVDAFLKDTSPKAFEKVVDRLLASRQYGERWGRHWLDVVRYADTTGCNTDFPVPEAWRYRNWVINAFNRDEPYMDFLREQLAGDLLPAKNSEDRDAKIIATGYIANSRRFGSLLSDSYLVYDDTVDNVGKAMLGLSISCAHCHDHKFDPIPERDYFALLGIFESTAYAFPGIETFRPQYDFEALGGSGNQKKLAAWEAEIKDAYTQLKEWRSEKNRDKPEAKGEMAKLQNQIVLLEMKPPAIQRAYAVHEGDSHNAKMQYKGDPERLGDEVPRGFLTVLGGEKLPPDEKGSGRKELAEWITDPKNPLTARVMVNRIWEGHFGKGIVATPNDFGVRGEPPTHPELLDWLASRFAELGYSVKTMHRMIMLTRAYQLSSADQPANDKKDPKNAYIWKFDRRRLEAEEIRDSLLAISAQLDPTPGGPHPFPPKYEWNYTQHKQFAAVYETNKRSVYLMQQRLRRHPLLALFDQADPNASTGVRTASVTALQALAFMNNHFVLDQADQFAVRVGMAYPDDTGRIRFAYQLALGRIPTAVETAEGIQYLAKARQSLKDSDLPAERQPRAALASYLHVLLASDEFLFVD